MSEQGFDRAVAAIQELSAGVRELHAEVAQSEELRTEKVRWIQRLMYVMVPAVLLLVLMAISNFVLLSRIDAAGDTANDTNELLLSCFLPESKCAQENRRATAEVMDQIRQTQFAIALCQRQNPLESDPSGAKVVRCVQSYYPNFQLPPKAAPAPGATP